MNRHFFKLGVISAVIGVLGVCVGLFGAHDLDSHNVSGDGYNPSQTIVARAIGLDRYTVCVAEGTGWICGKGDPIFVPAGKLPTGVWVKQLSPDQVPLGWVAPWMEVLICIFFLVGGVGLALAMYEPPRPKA